MPNYYKVSVSQSIISQKKRKPKLKWTQKSKLSKVKIKKNMHFLLSTYTKGLFVIGEAPN